MAKANIHKKIGIIGGGQLGQMMILEAKKMGFYITVLDPTLTVRRILLLMNILLRILKMKKQYVFLPKNQMLLHMNLSI